MGIKFYRDKPYRLKIFKGETAFWIYFHIPWRTYGMGWKYRTKLFYWVRNGNVMGLK